MEADMIDHGHSSPFSLRIARGISECQAARNRLLSSSLELSICCSSLRYCCICIGGNADFSVLVRTYRREEYSIQHISLVKMRLWRGNVKASAGCRPERSDVMFTLPFVIYGGILFIFL